MNPWKDASLPLVVSLVSTWYDEMGIALVNASPKTWWTPTSYDPPLLMLAVKPESDTATNIERTGLFALHVPPSVSKEVSRMVLHTAKSLPYGENELDDVGLAWHWQKHPETDKIKFVAIDGMPMFGCMVNSKLESGDHDVYEASVVLVSLSRDPSKVEPVESVMIHRGQNRFNWMGGAYEVERY